MWKVVCVHVGDFRIQGGLNCFIVTCKTCQTDVGICNKDECILHGVV